MTPFHPRLRSALLADPEHRKRGLTPALLYRYEQLEGQYFYTIHYPATQNAAEIYKFDEAACGDLQEDPDIPRGIKAWFAEDDGIDKTPIKDLLDALPFQTEAALFQFLLDNAPDNLRDALTENRIAILGHSAQYVSYQISPAMLDGLRAKNVSACVVDALAALSTKMFTNLSDFEGAIRRELANNSFAIGAFECAKDEIVRSAEALTAPGGGRNSESTVTVGRKLKAFQDAYLPNYNKIHADWVETQERQIKSGPFDVNVIRVFRRSLCFFLISAYVYGLRPVQRFFSFQPKQRIASSVSLAALEVRRDMPCWLQDLCKFLDPDG